LHAWETWHPLNFPAAQHLCSLVCAQALGRLLTHQDINERLKGRRAELWWPDDNLWYLIEIHEVDTTNHKAQARSFRPPLLSDSVLPRLKVTGFQAEKRDSCDAPQARLHLSQACLEVPSEQHAPGIQHNHSAPLPAIHMQGALSSDACPCIEASAKGKMPRVFCCCGHAQIMYVTGETEELDLREIVREGHMSLISENNARAYL
jgi:hypothetical protein